MRIFVLVVGAGLLSTVPATAQDAAAGEKVFAQCRACHQTGESAKNAVGPVLNGLFGARPGRLRVSTTPRRTRTPASLGMKRPSGDYIKDPKAKIPGTKMIFRA